MKFAIFFISTCPWESNSCSWKWACEKIAHVQKFASIRYVASIPDLFVSSSPKIDSRTLFARSVYLRMRRLSSPIMLNRASSTGRVVQNELMNATNSRKKANKYKKTGGKQARARTGHKDRRQQQLYDCGNKKKKKRGKVKSRA